MGGKAVVSGGTIATGVGAGTVIGVGGAVAAAGAAGYAVGHGIGSIQVGGNTIHGHLGEGMYWTGAKIHNAGTTAWNWLTSW